MRHDTHTTSAVSRCAIILLLRVFCAASTATSDYKYIIYKNMYCLEIMLSSKVNAKLRASSKSRVHEHASVETAIPELTA